MIRQHKKMILLTSIITLFPIFIGLLLWNQLPDSLATHWGINNEPNGYRCVWTSAHYVIGTCSECDCNEY